MDVSDIKVGETLQGHSAMYSVLRFLGEGAYGKVLECLNMDTNEKVAVKILMDPAAIQEAEDEMRMLETIGKLDSQRCNVVDFREMFRHRGLTCLVFEMLDISLWDISEKETLCLPELRPIAVQLLVALNALKDIEVIHSDLKPDNVMMTNMDLEPYRLKLIDFGLALPASEVQQGWIVQPDQYRAPEVTLGCMFDVGIDMWSLGCVLVFQLLEQHLFPASVYQSVKMIVDLFGMPPDYMLQNGVYTKNFFKKELDHSLNLTWRLLTPEEYRHMTNEDPGEPTKLQEDLKTIEDLVNMAKTDNPEELEDLKMFVDFIKGLLTIDPSLRLTPEQALQHSFITRAHLREGTDYSTAAKYVMRHIKPTTSQPQEVFPVPMKQHLEEDIEDSFSEGELYFVDDMDSSSDDDWKESSSEEKLTYAEFPNNTYEQTERTSSDCGYISDLGEPSDWSDTQSDVSDLGEPSDWSDTQSDVPDLGEPSDWTDTQSDVPDLGEPSDWSDTQSDVSDLGEPSDWSDTQSDVPDLGEPSDWTETSPLVWPTSQSGVYKSSSGDLHNINQNTDEETTPLEVSDISVGDTLCGHSAMYSVLRFLGEGAYGKVLECLNMDTNEKVAVKILMDPAAIQEAEDEMRMLERIWELDSHRCNVVDFREMFHHRGLTCLVFEMLDISLWDLVEKKALCVLELRPIALQLLVALNALKDIEVIHSDLKPDNVMMTNMDLEPYRLKLIDFGLALPASEVQQGWMGQADGYRAPEVTLGCMFDVGIDMWSLGCVLVFQLLKQHLFHASVYQSVKMIVDLFGMPPDYMLQNGVYTKNFFKKELDHSLNLTWRLLTPEEYRHMTNEDPGEPTKLQEDLKTIEDLVNMPKTDNPEELEDLKMFVDFIKGLLTIDPSLRLTPEQALQHSFITRAHLREGTDYSKDAKYVMGHQAGQRGTSPDDGQHCSIS